MTSRITMSGRVLARGRERLVAVGGKVDRVAGDAEPAPHHAEDPGIVVDDKHSLRLLHRPDASSVTSDGRGGNR